MLDLKILIEAQGVSSGLSSTTVGAIAAVALLLFILSKPTKTDGYSDRERTIVYLIRSG